MNLSRWKSCWNKALSLSYVPNRSPQFARWEFRLVLGYMRHRMKDDSDLATRSNQVITECPGVAAALAKRCSLNRATT